MTQANRYMHLAALTGRADSLDSAYHAAFYLLSYDKELYEIACKAVTYEGIDFAKIKRNTRSFDERTRFVVDIAHNLFSYYSPCKATPFEISRLGYPLMEQVCNALYIATEQVKIVVRQNENGKDEMTFDTTPYQSTKRTYNRMDQLIQSISAEQDETDELEH